MGLCETLGKSTKLATTLVFWLLGEISNQRSDNSWDKKVLGLGIDIGQGQWNSQGSSSDTSIGWIHILEGTVNYRT